MVPNVQCTLHWQIKLSHHFILLLYREREFERWSGEAFYQQGQRHGYLRRFGWDRHSDPESITPFGNSYLNQKVAHYILRRSQKFEKTSLKRISTSKCDICNHFFFDLGGNFFGFLWNFLEDFFDKIFLVEFFVRNFFWRIFFDGIFLVVFFGRNFLGRNFLGGYFLEEFYKNLFAYERN